MTKCRKRYLYYPGTIPDELPDGCEFFDVDGWIKESVHPRYWGIPARRWPVPEWKYKAHHWMLAFGIECPEGYEVVGFGLNEHPDHYILQRDGRVRYLYVGKIPHPLLKKIEPEIGGESEMTRQEAQRRFMCHKPIRHKSWPIGHYQRLSVYDGICYNHHNGAIIRPLIFDLHPDFNDGWEIYEAKPTPPLTDDECSGPMVTAWNCDQSDGVVGRLLCIFEGDEDHPYCVLLEENNAECFKNAERIEEGLSATEVKHDICKHCGNRWFVCAKGHTSPKFYEPATVQQANDGDYDWKIVCGDFQRRAEPAEEKKDNGQT